jgi:hypothetical protein
MTTKMREFEITPPDTRLIAIVPVSIMIGISVLIAIGAFPGPYKWMLLPLGFTAAAAMVWMTHRRRVAIDDAVLRLVGGVNSRRVAIADLELERAQVVNLTTNPALKPVFRTFATAIPGYRAGHFRMRDRSRAFLIVTDAKQVLHLRERGGGHLLLSLERPQALLEALRNVAEKSRRG